VRTHGWGGNPPRDDDEAIARILDATRKQIDDNEGSVKLSDVARVLGVTRQTVYRYFSGTEELLQATAVSAVDELLDRVAARIEGIAVPDAVLVEGVAVVIDELSRDRYVGLMLRSDHLSLGVLGGITGELGRTFIRSMLGRLDVDWAAYGYTESDFDDVAEMALRTLQSLILDDVGDSRSAADLRRFLDRWLGSGIRAIPAARPLSDG
jgi:AcrR family transcriptional regulator